MSESFKQKTNIVFDDLKVHRVLGVGGFGRVSLVTHKPTGEPYALKALFKGLVIAKRQVGHIMNERKLLGACVHPFLPRLYSTYQNPKELYLLMDLIVGGELFAYLVSRDPLSEPDALFYTANVATIFEFLHERSIAYRDLKPENLLFDTEGYLKLVDFGFAKVVEDRTYTVCGTPEYLAPETIQRQGHTWPVDWWALGILLYEMLAGYTPFQQESQMDILHSIVHDEIHIPPYFSDSSASFILKLLERNPRSRLGTRDKGKKGVRDQLKMIDFGQLFAKKLPAPYVPKVADPTDISNFSELSPEDIKDTGDQWNSHLETGPDPFLDW